jgi:hypothetical protein
MIHNLNRPISIVSLYLFFALMLTNCGSDQRSDGVRPPSVRGEQPGQVDRDVITFDLSRCSMDSGTLSTDFSTITDHFVFESKLPSYISDLLICDLKFLESIGGESWVSDNGELGALMGGSRYWSGDLLGWLKERVTYIISPDRRHEQMVYIYPQRQVYYYEDPNREINQPEKMVGVMATNRGAAIFKNLMENYDSEKTPKGVYVELDEKWIEIRSARVGIIRLGGQLLNLTQSSSLYGGTDSLVGRWERLVTLLHEGRHSDGNRDSGSLGFPHIRCPDNGSVPKELVGEAACDSMSNGAYAISAQLMKMMWRHSQERGMDMKIQMALQASYLDYYSRLISPENGPILDTQPQYISSGNYDLNKFTDLTGQIQ